MIMTPKSPKKQTKNTMKNLQEIGKTSSPQNPFRANLNVERNLFFKEKTSLDLMDVRKKNLQSGRPGSSESFD